MRVAVGSSVASVVYAAAQEGIQSTAKPKPVQSQASVITVLLSPRTVK